MFERNGFNCGLMHWIGLVPQKRWGGNEYRSDNEGIVGEQQDDGSGVLPLARYLHSLGVGYESTSQNSNTQGHTPNHKVPTLVSMLAFLIGSVLMLRFVII